MNAKDKQTVIYAYLCEKFPNAMVEHKNDFDWSAQSFKVRLPDRVLLLKVEDEFIDDNATAEILHQFDLWSLAEILGKEMKLGVLVSHHGIGTFHRG